MVGWPIAAHLLRVVVDLWVPLIAPQTHWGPTRQFLCLMSLVCFMGVYADLLFHQACDRWIHP